MLDFKGFLGLVIGCRVATYESRHSNKEIFKLLYNKITYLPRASLDEMKINAREMKNYKKKLKK